MSAEVAIVFALAEAFIPPLSCAADEAQGWLRIMSDHGAVGDALQALGAVSGKSWTPAGPATPPSRHGANPVAAVSIKAAELASARGASAVLTVDVLFAVISLYGSLFDRALYAITSKRRDDLLVTLAGGVVISA